MGFKAIRLAYQFRVALFAPNNRTGTSFSCLLGRIFHSTMCIIVRRLCPGCGTVTDFSELTNCEKKPRSDQNLPGTDTDTPPEAPKCEGTVEWALPLRREHFAAWDCRTLECSFNNDHLRTLEREYVMARLDANGGDLEKLAPDLTTEGEFVHAVYLS